jgi:hypothetical protein
LLLLILRMGKKGLEKAPLCPVTKLPRFTTELPFFYLTKQSEALNAPIEFTATDDQGKPIKWKVTPSSVGAPGINAHEVFIKLIKPSIDEQREKHGHVPQIIPLGGIRQCLRALGWSESGRMQRHFLTCLEQIAYAGCEADFYLPKHDPESERTVYHRIKARFARLSIYAIGTKHITDEEVGEKGFDFGFDLEDTVYLELHPIEVEIQQHQLQRPIDNSYLFSLSPSARRWYELVSPKIFGIVSNPDGPGYCEIRYSWYVKRHHTLKQCATRREVKKQMDKIHEDHLKSGYLSRVEYRDVVPREDPPDFIIRYYPGGFAQESIRRIKNHLAGKNMPQLNVPEPLQITDGVTAGLTEEQTAVFERLVKDFGVAEGKAAALAAANPEGAGRQMDAFGRRKVSPQNRAGYIIDAIEKDYPLPDSSSTRYPPDAKGAGEKKGQASKAKTCPLCQGSNGFRYRKKGGLGYCTHDPEVEREHDEINRRNYMPTVDGKFPEGGAKRL